MVTGRMLVPASTWGRGRWLVGDTSTSHTATPTLLPWRFIPSSCPVEEEFLGTRHPKGAMTQCQHSLPNRLTACLCVPPSMGVRVMDTSWVARRGTSGVRKASSTPPAAQPPAPPAELPAVPHSPIPEQSPDISATPSPPPTSFGFPPGAERTR